VKTKRDLYWVTMMGELEAFRAAYGHLRVEEQRKRYPVLAGWWLRTRGQLQMLSYDQILSLDSLGFFEHLDQRWLDRYARLKDFKEAKGHCRVLSLWREHPPLGHWVRNQRGKAGTMIPWRLKLLTDLGFDWAPVETTWLTRYEDLMAFKRRFGHTYVPAPWAENRELATWVVQQRSRKERLSPKQIAMLDKVGFDWEPCETVWTQHYEELKAFRRKHGHCNPEVSKSELGKWVHKQRCKANRMPLHRKKLLDELGFSWGGKVRDAWMRQYEQLNAYHLKYGRFPASRMSPLGHWVSNQRTMHTTGRMLPERKRLLEEIGFAWRVYAGW
jgi:hypothetical protein